jgi:hypothetical protein
MAKNNIAIPLTIKGNKNIWLKYFSITITTFSHKVKREMEFGHF